MRALFLLLIAALLIAGCVSPDTTNNAATATQAAGQNPGAAGEPTAAGSSGVPAVIPYDENAAPGSNEVMDTQHILFYPPVAFVPKGMVGERYNYSYCEPGLSSVSDTCAPEGYFGNPSLGNPPYHFQLDSGKGFPSMGLVLHPNGIVDGVPTVEGVSNFTVCAIDQSGTQACAPESIEVVTAKATFDSLTCTTEQVGDDYKYIIVAKGTATAPIQFTFNYRDNLNELNERYPDANIYEGGSMPDSTCGAWPGNNNAYCQNSNDIPTTNWVAAYYMFSPLKPTDINASIYVDAGYYFVPAHTTTVWKTVTCG